MSSNPTTRIAVRRRFIADRTAVLKAELDALAAEESELDVAERVLKRFSEGPAIGGNAPATPQSEKSQPNGHDLDEDDHGDGPTLPQMTVTILNEARADGRKGADGAEILRIIRERWKPDFTPDKVRPTLWRMVKGGRLKKRGKIYSLPISSPEGETEAGGASARH
jgi:hypothetical protein